MVVVMKSSGNEKVPHSAWRQLVFVELASFVACPHDMQHVSQVVVASMDVRRVEDDSDVVGQITFVQTLFVVGQGRDVVSCVHE